ncbi:hypothetical protein P879_10770 [Paragonimus westermani]|uniref:Uncharacterized protein n=1 Tax=Paragonimus westermani TaxID=34504 RepID=A0A8T0DAE6_9TREM|nr:hypothetical protein P879_10770 [Paragonimus westermani]
MGNLWDQRRGCNNVTAVSSTLANLAEIRSVCSLVPVASELSLGGGQPGSPGCLQAAVGVCLCSTFAELPGADVGGLQAPSPKSHGSRNHSSNPPCFTQKPVEDGAYIYLGLEAALCNLLKRELVDTVGLQLHTDDFPPSEGQVCSFGLSSVNV